MKNVPLLISALLKLNNQILKSNGFLASLKEITEEVRKLWKPGKKIPMTLAFFKKEVVDGHENRSVDYWQPGWHTGFAKQLEFVVYCRTQVRLGAVEVLTINNAVKLDERDMPAGEMVLITCHRKDEVTCGTLEVAIGAQNNYLKAAVFTTAAETHNPVINPWSTDEEQG
jgi:hypothetical protein